MSTELTMVNFRKLLGVRIMTYSGGEHFQTSSSMCSCEQEVITAWYLLRIDGLRAYLQREMDAAEI